jgi:hypothetical protein
LNGNGLDSLVNTDSGVLTDLLNNEEFMSRAKIVSNVNDAVFEKYKVVLVDSFEYSLGKVNIYRIKK